MDQSTHGWPETKGKLQQHSETQQDTHYAMVAVSKCLIIIMDIFVQFYFLVGVTPPFSSNILDMRRQQGRRVFGWSHRNID